MVNSASQHAPGWGPAPERPQRSWGRQALATMRLRGDEVVLDAGCGDEQLTAGLVERLPRGRVIALYRSPEALQAARERLEPRFGPRLSFLCGEPLRVRLEVRPELIFSNAALHASPDQPRLLRGFYALLAPGGRLLAQCGGGPGLQLRQRAAELVRKPPYQTFFPRGSRLWPYAEDLTVAEQLLSAGFVDIKTSLELALARFAGPEECRDFLAGQLFASHLPWIPAGPLRERFLDELVAAGRDGPAFRIEYWWLNLRGRRPRC